MKGVIDDVVIDPSRIQPIIVNFQNGALKDEEAAKMKCGLFYDSEQKKTVLGLSNGQIVYKGHRPDTSSDLMQTMLVVHNKRTGKIRLLQAERWQVSPVLHNSTADNETKNASDKIAELNKQFGSKKAKRKTEQSERMRINVEAVKEQLENTASNVQIQNSDFASISMDSMMEESGIPKCNRDTTNLNDVYNLYDILPEDKLESLYDAAKEILQKPSQGECKFFEVMLNRLKSNPDNVKKVAILMYIDAVCKWLCMPIKQGKKQGIDICPVSQDVNSHILKCYSIPSIHGRTRPNSIRDKGLIHCIILALMISKFSLDLELFSTLLKTRIGLKKLTELARVIGALPSKDDKKIVTLKLPLPQPLSVVKKIRKK